MNIKHALAIAGGLALSPCLLADENLHLDQILDTEWNYQASKSPWVAMSMGDKSLNGQWGDMSLKAHAAAQIHSQQYLATLKAVDRSALSKKQQLNLDLAIYTTEDSLEAFRQNDHLLPLTMREGPQSAYDSAGYINFNERSDYQDWLSRMKAVPEYLAQYEELMRHGMKQGVVQPCIVMQRVTHQLAALQVDEPINSDWYKPFASKKAQKISDIEGLQIEAQRVIDTTVLPAYAQFADFFNNEYLKTCRPTPGVGNTESGKAYYRYLAKHFTTTDLTPEEIHTIGLEEVARIRSEMLLVMEEVGFEGDLHAFFDYLRTDPKFYYDNPEDLMNAYLATAKRLDPELVNLFGHLPRTPYGVKAIPDAIAPDTTTAYYMPLAGDGSRAGYYYVNLYMPESRPIWEIEVLSVHESVPGHHLQIAIAKEQKDLPPFRRNMGIGAYVEGWGLYSERLGYDMGLYQDPYSKFGQLTYDMWRSVRLVVDTGIHYFGWSRERAIDFFADNAPKSKLDIVNEVDRYIGWPGQALGYKIGQLKILEIRAYAEEQLGDQFDIRAFHDAILETGAVPLAVMERRMHAWVSAQLQG